MGGAVSSMPFQDANFPYFSATLRSSDRVRLIGASKQVIDIIRNAIIRSYQPGIQKEDSVEGIYDFKFRGYPFQSASHGTQSKQTRQMLCGVLAELRRNGWTHIAAADLSRYYELSTSFFRYDGINPAMASTKVVAIGISSYDKISIVDGDDTILYQIKDAIHPDIQALNTEQAGEGYYTIKINGYPWQNRDFGTGIMARLILLRIFKNMLSIGYRFYGAMNPKGQADTLFFIKDPMASNFANCQYAMLSLNKSDRLRLIDLPMEVRPLVCQLIKENWDMGLQEEIEHDDRVHEFKMHGYPWRADGKEAISARQLISRIFAMLLERGFCVETALDISRNANDKGVFVLRTCQPARLGHFALVPTSTDKIKIVDAPKDVFEIFQNVVNRMWSPGIAKTVTYFTGLSYKLNGSPWCSSSLDWALARLMITHFIAEVKKQGWDCICSADISAKYVHRENAPDYPIDVHSMFFVKTGDALQSDDGASSSIQPTAPTVYGFLTEEPPPSYEYATKS